MASSSWIPARPPSRSHSTRTAPSWRSAFRWSHCSGADLLTALLDLTPEPRPAPPDDWEPEKPPGDFALLGRAALSMSTRPWHAVKFTTQIIGAAPALGVVAKPYVPKAIDGVLGRGSRDGGVLDGTSLLPPRTLLNQSITAHRRWTYSSVSLFDVKAVKNAYGVTVNDVVMSMSTGALRRWLIDHDALPDESLVAMVPVSVRQDDQMGAYGDKVSSMFAVLPTNLEDPVARLKVSHEATMLAKQQHTALPTGLVEDVTEFMVPGLTADVPHGFRCRWA